MKDSVRILIVDDSATYRHVLTRVVSEIPEAELVGTAANGKIALRKVDKLTPDLVLLDVTMPDIDGVETLRLIKKKDASIQAIMISGIDKANAKATLLSLEIGAMDFISKPTSNNLEESIQQLITQLKPLIGLIQIKKYSFKRQRTPTSPTNRSTFSKQTALQRQKTTPLPTRRPISVPSHSSPTPRVPFASPPRRGPRAT